jgi:alpha-tubulin suppressor-like RCC1 family protein
MDDYSLITNTFLSNENSLKILPNEDESQTNKFIQVACGMYHSVGLKENGTVVIWGNNLYKQRDKEIIKS